MPCDVTSREACNRAVAGADAVFHVASRVQTRRSGGDAVWAVNHARRDLGYAPAVGINEGIRRTIASLPPMPGA